MFVGRSLNGRVSLLNEDSSATAVSARSRSHPYASPPASDGAPSAKIEKKRPHVCPTCSKAFTTSGHLARHVRVHTGERNHKCPFPGCDTKCSRQDNLQQHYRIHLSPRSRRTSHTNTRAAIATVIGNNLNANAVVPEVPQPGVPVQQQPAPRKTKSRDREIYTPTPPASVENSPIASPRVGDNYLPSGLTIIMPSENAHDGSMRSRPSTGEQIHAYERHNARYEYDDSHNNMSPTTSTSSSASSSPVTAYQTVYHVNGNNGHNMEYNPPHHRAPFVHADARSSTTPSLSSSRSSPGAAVLSYPSPTSIASSLSSASSSMAVDDSATPRFFHNYPQQQQQQQQQQPQSQYHDYRAPQLNHPYRPARSSGQGTGAVATSPLELAPLVNTLTTSTTGSGSGSSTTTTLPPILSASGSNSAPYQYEGYHHAHAQPQYQHHEGGAAGYRPAYGSEGQAASAYTYGPPSSASSYADDTSYRHHQQQAQQQQQQQYLPQQQQQHMASGWR